MSHSSVLKLVHRFNKDEISGLRDNRRSKKYSYLSDE